MDHIKISPDRRFKIGHVQRNGNELRGHPDTVLPKNIKELKAHMANPPMVVSKEMARAIRKMK